MTTTTPQPPSSVPAGCGAALEPMPAGNSRWRDRQAEDWRRAHPHSDDLPYEVDLTPTGRLLCPTCAAAWRAGGGIRVTVGNTLVTPGLHCGAQVKVTTPGPATGGHYPGCGANLARLPKTFAHISEQPQGAWVNGEWQSGAAALERSSAAPWPAGTRTLPSSYDAAWADAKTAATGEVWGPCGANVARLKARGAAHLADRPLGYWGDAGDWVSTPPTPPRGSRHSPEARSAAQPTGAVLQDGTGGKWDPELGARMWALVEEIRAQHAEIRAALGHRAA